MMLRTLGGLELRGAHFTQPKPLLLLAYLSVEGTKSKRHLADLFWQDGNRMKSLSMALTRLRQGAGDLVQADKVSLWTTLPSDVGTLLEALERKDWQGACELYTGAFLDATGGEGWSSELEEWVYETREYLAGRVQQALLNLAEDAARKRDFDPAARLAERAYRLPGLSGSEPSSLLAIYPLLRAGDSLLAASVSKEAESYGLTLDLSPAEAKATFGPATTTPHRLPVRGTSFVGRDEELTELATTLSSPSVSLLTLLGPAGVGKTRLTLQLAHDQVQLATFSDGVYFITLDALQEPSLLPSSLLTQLGQNQEGTSEPLAQLLTFLSEKRCLVILDNFEHLTEGSNLLSSLIHNCPNLKLLVTTRERLNLEEEHVFTLTGLAYPQNLSEGAGLSDAVRLFSARAQQVQPRFEVEPQLADVLHICHLVEGLPLGLELAASWVRLMPCAEIAEEISRNLEFLSTTTRNVPERHRSLKAAFEQSWQRLTPKEQAVLRKLSVFVGGFRREAASDVAGATIPVLASLVDKSLLKVLPEGRYERHPLLYQFTKEKLDVDTEEAALASVKHADFFTRFAVSADAELRSRHQQQWLARLDEENDNLRGALAWALQHVDRNSEGLGLASSLQHFWYLRGYFREGREWLDAFLSREAGAPSLAYLKALCASARLGHAQGDYESAQAAYQTCIDFGEALAAQDLEDIVVRAQEGLGIMAQERGDYATARTFAEKCLAFERTRNNDTGISSSLNNLGIVAYYERNFSEAHTFFAESLKVRRRLGDDTLVSASLNNLGLVALGQENVIAAKTYFEEGLIIQKTLGDKRGLALTYSNIAMIEEELEDYDTAKQLATEGLKIVVEIGYKRAATLLLGTLATAAAAQDETWRAAMFWGALEHLRETTGIPLHDSDKASYEQCVSLVRERLGGAAFASAWHEGRVLTLEQTLELALSDWKPKSAPATEP